MKAPHWGVSALSLLALSFGAQGCAGSSQPDYTTTTAATSSGSGGSASGAPQPAASPQPAPGRPGGATQGLRAIALSGLYFGSTTNEVVICGFHEDLRGLTQVSLQVERGGVFVDSGIASTRLYYALNNQAHYAGDAGFLNFNDTSAAGVTTRRYRIQAQSLGQTITSNVITARPTAPGGQVQVNEPQGAHTWLTPPAVRAADRLAWGPSAERSIVTLYRLESSSTTGGWAVAVEGVFEVDQAQFSWGDPTTETWVQARTPLPPGRYALDVMNIDRDGWVTGWSTDRARGSDAFYRFDLY